MIKTISFKKLGKFDYTNLNIFCFKSIFLSLDKVMKVVITKKISYSIKRYGLLLFNHYIAFEQKSLINTFNIV